MTVNLLDIEYEHTKVKTRIDLITPSNSRQSCSNKGIRSIHKKQKREREKTIALP